MREELSVCASRLFPRWITPACAGRTDKKHRTHPPRRDHPRVCGKNNPRSVMQLKGWGSPPRVREELCIRLFIRTIDRITPACAGRTSRTANSFHGHGDHPRVCGKNLGDDLKTKLLPGSPPRVREELKADTTGARQDRITPACAGRTSGVIADIDRTKDHPRVCGKNTTAIRRPIYTRGSPPRVREELYQAAEQSGRVGITPACAGRTYRIKL